MLITSGIKMRNKNKKPTICQVIFFNSASSYSKFDKMNKLNNLFKNEEPKKQQYEVTNKKSAAQEIKIDKEGNKLTKLFDNKLEIKPEPKQVWRKDKKFSKRNYDDDFPTL
jgi:hypothetical protein